MTLHRQLLANKHNWALAWALICPNTTEAVNKLSQRGKENLQLWMYVCLKSAPDGDYGKFYHCIAKHEHMFEWDISSCGWWRVRGPRVSDLISEDRMTLVGAAARTRHTQTRNLDLVFSYANRTNMPSEVSGHRVFDELVVRMGCSSRCTRNILTIKSSMSSVTVFGFIDHRGSTRL